MKKLKEFLVFCLSTALSLSLLAACGKPQIPMAGAETPAEPSSAASEGSLRVMASFYPMYDFAQKIGGDKVTVTNMVPAGTEPHDWEPSPSDIVALEQADVFVYSGAGMEHWVEDVLASLDNQSLVTVEASYHDAPSAPSIFTGRPGALPPAPGIGVLRTGPAGKRHCGDGDGVSQCAVSAGGASF